jgi:hypothetical protein
MLQTTTMKFAPVLIAASARQTWASACFLSHPSSVALPGIEVYQTKPNNGTNHFESHRSHRLLNPSKLSQSAFLLKHQQMNMLVF